MWNVGDIYIPVINTSSNQKVEVRARDRQSAAPVFKPQADDLMECEIRDTTYRLRKRTDLKSSVSISILTKPMDLYRCVKGNPKIGEDGG